MRLRKTRRKDGDFRAYYRLGERYTAGLTMRRELVRRQLREVGAIGRGMVIQLSVMDTQNQRIAMRYTGAIRFFRSKYFEINKFLYSEKKISCLN